MTGGEGRGRVLKGVLAGCTMWRLRAHSLFEAVQVIGVLFARAYQQVSVLICKFGVLPGIPSGEMISSGPLITGLNER